MKLISCGYCGVVLDVSRIGEPPAFDESGKPIENSIWDGYDYIPLIECPVCKEKITYTEGEHY